jgi:uncharacterized protein YgbK (DUF1537 family)
VVSTAFIRDFLIGEADIASFSCYSKPPASAGGVFTPLKTVLAGPGAIKVEALEHWKNGCRILAFDAVTNDDIADIAEAFRETPFPVVVVDPGPFTAELAAKRIAPSGVEFTDSVLAVIGSTSELTRRQIEALSLAHEVHMVRLDCKALLDPAKREAEIAAAVTAIAKAPAKATVLGVCTAERAEDVFSMDELSKSMNTAPSKISENINAALALIAEHVLARPELKIGGRTPRAGRLRFPPSVGSAGRGSASAIRLYHLRCTGIFLAARFRICP